MKCVIIEIIKRTMKIMNSHLAMSADVPATLPNPNNAATTAITRKVIAQLNNPLHSIVD